MVSSRGMQEEVKNLQVYMEKHFSRQELLMEDRGFTTESARAPFGAIDNLTST